MTAQRILASGAAALLALIVLAIVFHDDGGSGGASATTVPPPASGTVRAHVVGGSVTLDGPVPNADEQTAIDAAAAKRFGKGNVVSRLVVHPEAESVKWLADVMPALPRDGEGFGTIDIVVTQPTLTVRGRVPTAAAGNALLKAVNDASNRTAVDQLSIVAEGAGGTLQANIDDAIKGRTIAFTTGSAAIAKSGQTVLLALVKPLRSAGSARVVVGGYTDNVGASQDNLKLSQARAHSVVVFLTKHGVNTKVLVAKGNGEAKPIAPNTTEAGRQKNRRIEFTVLSG
jgi:OmpA-OmpF porin, OOP family